MSYLTTSSYTQVKSLMQPLHQQVTRLSQIIDHYQQKHFLGAILFGSCCRGEATYRSDIDILLIFETMDLNLTVVQKTRDRLEAFFQSQNAEAVLQKPLPVEFQIVLLSVFSTQEPEMLKNLKQGLILSDKQGLLKKEKDKLHE